MFPERGPPLGVTEPAHNRLWIAALVVVQVAVSGALIMLSLADAGDVGSLPRVIGLAALFALVGLIPIHLELGRSTITFTLSAAVLVIALFTLGPLGVVLTATVGDVFAGITQRQSPLKVVYAGARTGLAATVAALTFAAVGGVHAHGAAGYGAALLATATFALCSHASTSLALAVSGEGSFEDVFLVAAWLAGLSSAVSGSIGLALRALSAQGWVAPLLLGPLIGVVLLETRRSTAQLAERLRFERLYAASARTTGLQGFQAALAQAAGEARGLVTGRAAVCCAPDRDGVWRGVIVDDEGAHPASEATIQSVITIVTKAAGAEVRLDALPAAVREGLPAGRTAVVAGTTITSSPGQEGGIGLVVVRDVGVDEQSEARAKVLWAFVFHAALTTTNALLFERVEDALRQQVDLNRQKDEFLAAVSHELRTPLASMLGSVETLRRLEGRMDPDARQRFFSIAHRQGRRLQRLIEELLLTAALEHREEAVMAETVDMGDLLDEVAEDLAVQAQDRIVVDRPPDPLVLTTDPNKVRQILTNLLENAIKYAPVGLIEVRAAVTPDDRVEVTVRDHGPGIAATDHGRVFERFVQLDGSSTRAQGGTGLGLYLCARLADLLQGSIDLTDTPGGGATFTVVLPRAHSTAFVPISRSRPEAAEIPKEGAKR